MFWENFGIKEIVYFETGGWITVIWSAYITGAQEWHIVSLLGDVTSPTTVAHYGSMTSDYVFWEQRSTDRRADSTRCKQTSD